MERSTFDVTKYLGTWYELMHYPSWFQRNDNYNTTAEYTLNSDSTIKVHNCTISNGKRFDSYGTATMLSEGAFRVDFSIDNKINLTKSREFIRDSEHESGREHKALFPNYVLDTIWKDKEGNYLYAVVTDAKGDSLYVLSRTPHPCLKMYSEIMEYVISKYDRDRLVQTPHY
jgi:lipocalin